MTDDDARVRALLDEVAAGYRHKDPERIVGHDAEDITMFDLAPPLRQRRGDTAEIGGGQKVDMTTVEGVRRWLAGFGDAPFDYETKDVEVAVDGSVAYAHLLARMGSPGTFSLWFRVTVGLRKREGRWLVTHSHSSVPFYMDGTGRAALDLSPGDGGATHPARASA